jgi:uncharacterized membrane protein YccC
MVRLMLHMRRGALPRGVTVVGSIGLTVWDRLAAADPGLVRLTMAVRGTLSVFLTTVAALLAERLVGISPVECASGITLSLIAVFLMREPTRRQRQLTLATLSLPAAAATVATALLHGYGPAGDSWFLVLVFLCFLCHPRNARLIGVGLIAVVTTYIGLYLELPPSTLPVQLLSIVLALPVTAFACFVVVPMRPAATLRRTVAAVQGRAAQVLHSARAVTGDGSAPERAQDRAMARLRRDLARLNEAALAADDQLPLLDAAGRDGVRAGLIEIELATARLVEVLREAPPGPRDATRLKLHERRMRRGGRYVVSPDPAEHGALLAALVALGHAIHALGVAARDIGPATEVALPIRPPPGPFAWRLATRVTLAAGLAMAGGMALSPQRWFWAVLTVYVVFLNARSRGDTIYKGFQRLGGTLLGIVLGLILATLLEGDPRLQAVVLLMSIFGMYYWIMVSYTLGIFCVTVMLGLIYGLLGASLESLLILRLEETAIGAVAAMLVAAFVLPIRTREQVLRSGRGVLNALAAAVRASREALSGKSEASPMQAMRLVDRQMADLRLAMAPLTAARFLLRRSALERPMPALLDCVHWARVLAAASQERAHAMDGVADGVADGQTDRETLVVLAARIERRLAELAGATGASAPPTTAAAPQGEAANPPRVKAALDRLDSAVALLAERLEIGALEGFALDA